MVNLACGWGRTYICPRGVFISCGGSPGAIMPGEVEELIEDQAEVYGVGSGTLPVQTVSRTAILCQTRVLEIFTGH